MEPRTPRYRRALRLTSGTFLVYALLVATHLGEFWPFSIYPMFSRGGYPWARAVVREVPADSAAWTAARYEDLPGRVYPLDLSGINQNDLANFVSKSDAWSPRRTAALRTLFEGQLEGRSLMVFRADGRLDDARLVQVRYTPQVLLRPDTTLLHPDLTPVP